MGLDARRRGTGFAPEFYDDILQGEKPTPNEPDRSISQAAGERLGDRQSRGQERRELTHPAASRSLTDYASKEVPQPQVPLA